MIVKLDWLAQKTSQKKTVTNYFHIVAKKKNKVYMKFANSMLCVKETVKAV